MIFVINRAQAYKWSGDEHRAEQILGAEDFTALQDKFQLAAAVLRNDFPQALKFVRRMGNSGPNAASEYREWPLYQELRKRADFAELFQEVFGQPLDFVTTVAPNSVEESAKEQLDCEIVSEPDEPSSVPTENETFPTKPRAGVDLSEGAFEQITTDKSA
jgi:hypothetical protein